MSCPGCKHEFENEEYKDFSFGVVSLITGVATLLFIIGVIFVRYSGV